MTKSNTPNRPILSMAIGPKNPADSESLHRGLQNLAQEDPTMNIATDPDGQTIVSGMGELHLEIICERLRREYKVQLDPGHPRVLYLETIRGQAEAEGKYIRQTGGKGQYAHVRLRIEPQEQGKGYEFVNEVVGESIREDFIEPINQGIQQALESGILAGYPMVDLKATVYDGSYHDLDSNELTFKIAGAMAFLEAARKASPVLLEPVMALEVYTPEDYAGAIMGDLSSRRGLIEGMQQRADLQVIAATVPFAEMLGYGPKMRSITQGRASYNMNFAHYEVAPLRGESGPEEIGVTANKPRGPKSRTGSAAANLDGI